MNYGKFSASRFLKCHKCIFLYFDITCISLQKDKALNILNTKVALCQDIFKLALDSKERLSSKSSREDMCLLILKT